MKVVSLVGPSGSGKSYNSIMVAKKLNIEYIIDDGILIKGNKVIAGKSAKGENTTIGAVKIAIFEYYSHRMNVKKIIDLEKPESILILGTSDKMIGKITKALELPKVSERIYIHEITSEQDIKKANEERNTKGKHIIPVPTFEVKKDFSGYFIDSLKILKKRNDIKEQVYEKTVVRPTFSYLGKYTISDAVIRDIVRYNLDKIDEIYKVMDIYTKNRREGIIIDVEICIVYGYNIPKVAKHIRERLAQEIDNMTSINILAINIVIKKMVVKESDFL